MQGNPRAFNFPKARLSGPWDFSFSGLKTAVLRAVEEFKAANKPVPTADVAASFQAAVVGALFEKTIAAAREFKVREIVVAGGVSANKALREAFRSQTEFRVHIPHFSLCTDNAAMIAAAGFRHFIADETSSLDFDVQANWPLAVSA